MGYGPSPKASKFIGTRSTFCKKVDESYIVIRKKTKLVAKGYCQQEGIDYDETYDLVARLESICIFLTYTDHTNINVHQMDVKSVFLNRELKEEVYL